MKKIFTILTLCFLVQLAMAQAPVPELIYYDFNGAGTSVTNLATAPPAGTTTATINGSLTQSGSASCYIGALVGASGTSGTDNVSTGWATNLSGDWTISFVYTNQSTPIFSYLFGDASAASFRCFTNGAAGADNTILRGPINDVVITGGAAVGTNTNTWVYDGTAGEVRGYLNGVLDTIVSQTPPTISGTGPFLVGGYSSSAGLTTGASMDDFRVYNRALTPTEVMGVANPCATALTDISNIEVSIFPNPTNNITNVNLGNYNGSINYTVTSIDGKLVKQEINITNNNITIDLSNESKGIYFLNIGTENDSKVYKVIKQ